MSTDFPIALILILPVIAFLYAAVGHGGASGYLALMSMMGLANGVMKPTALLLNIVVSGIAFFFFQRAGYFRLNLFLAFALGSVPASFFGGMIEMDPVVYKMILGIFLVVATVKLLGGFDCLPASDRYYLAVNQRFVIAASIGAIIGFFSGLIGIGGGIILSPVLLILGWVNLKEAAAISALFIFVNSVAGFSAQLMTGIELTDEIAGMAALAAVGGILGSFHATCRFNNRVLRNLLAVVLLTASVKLMVF